MAHKSLLNCHLPLHEEDWLPQPDRSLRRDLKQGPEIATSPSTPKGTAGLQVLDGHPLHSSALQEMLESDHYQVALVPRGAWDHIQGSQEGPLSLAAPPFLLPFSWKELVARALRNTRTLVERRIARFQDVCVDFAKMEVRRASGESITLTTQEFKTLKCFLLNPDRVFSREELLNEAWGYENYPSSRTVDNHVLKLRQKLEMDPGQPVHFRTVHGAGYKFVP